MSVLILYFSVKFSGWMLSWIFCSIIKGNVQGRVCLWLSDRIRCISFVKVPLLLCLSRIPCAVAFAAVDWC